MGTGAGGSTAALGGPVPLVPGSGQRPAEESSELLGAAGMLGCWLVWIFQFSEVLNSRSCRSLAAPESRFIGC